MSIKISIVFIRNDRPFSKELWERGIRLLPPSFRETIQRYHFWKDRQARLLSKLLQAHVLSETIPGLKLTDVKYGEFNKPYVDQNMAFNLSHSGEYVVCASAPYCNALGIDIEKITDQNRLEDFKGIFSTEEWKHIHATSDPLVTFYNLWTLKESASKADGRGLQIALNQIRVAAHNIVIGSEHWNYEKIAIADGYICHLSVNATDYEITIQEKSIFEVLNPPTEVSTLRKS